MALEDIPPEVRAEYVAMRELPDGRVIGVHRFLYTWGLIIDIDPVGYADRYCYHDLAGAMLALVEWQGVGDPAGWHRHLATARRRDVATGREYIAF